MVNVAVARGRWVALVAAGAVAAGGCETETTPGGESSNDGGGKTEKKAKRAKPKQRSLDRQQASGDYAIAQASGSIDDPAEIKLRVRTTPPQQVQATWTMVCAQGGGAGNSDDQFNAQAPFTRKLKFPAKKPSDCTVSANAQMEQGGKVVVQLLGRER